MSGIRRARDHSRRHRFTAATAVVLAGLVVLLLAAAGAFADAGNPITGSIKATAVDNGNGTVTVYVRGQWNWLSHTTDCNVDRAATGVGIIWDDLNSPTYGQSGGTTRGNNEVQKIALGGTTTGAHFTISFKNPAGTNSTSAAINSTDSAATVQSKLQAMASIGSGNALVTAVAGGWTVEFAGALSLQDVGAMTAGGKTGGLTVTISTPTAGSAPVYNGYLVSNKGVSAYVGTSAATSQNPVDQMVHPVDRGNQVEGYRTAGTDYPANQTFFDPTNNSVTSTATWRGGCGRDIPPSTVGTATASPKGGTDPGYGESTGRACGTTPASTVCSGHPWGSWGYEKCSNTSGAGPCAQAPGLGGRYGYSHTYVKTLPDGSSGLPDKVCVNFYDVHTQTNGSYVSKSGDITVNGNGDNSIQTNAFNVNDTSQGGNCIAIQQSAITTTATASITIGASGGISDTAHLSGVPANAGGTITFQVFGPSATAVCSTALDTFVVTASGPGDYSSSADHAFNPTTAGKYYWIASYSGDASKLVLPASTSCGDTGETSDVGKKQPAVSTDAGGPYTIGANGMVALTDTATLSNAFLPLGANATITFQLFADDGSGGCGTQIGSNDPVAITTNGSVTSDPITVSATGTYHWIANFNGDDNNFATSNTCGGTNENPVVNPRDTSITTDAGGPYTLDPVNGNDLADKATISGGTSDAGGHLTFFLYSDANCNTKVNATAVTATEDPIAHGADGTHQYTSNTVHVSTAGTYHWRAFYSGDGKNNSSHTDCLDTGENPIVNTPSINIDKSPDNQTIETGTAATFTIVVSNNGSTALDSVSVSDPNSSDCNRSASDIDGLLQTKYSHGLPLGAGESVSYTCQSPVQGANTTFHNTATDQGTSQGVTVMASDSADVKIIHPKIDVAKDPKVQSIPAGGTANWTITVTNNGDTPLSSIVVTDAQASGCERTASQTDALSLAQNGHTGLNPGESFSYTCTKVLQAADFDVNGNFLNIVQACGNDELGNNTCDNDNTGGGPPGCPEAARCGQVSLSGVTTMQDFAPRDTGTISGLVGSPGGTLTFSLFTGPGCDPANQLDLNGGAPGDDLTKVVTANGDYTAISVDLLSAMLDNAFPGTAPNPTDGTYNWLVSYSGDNQGNAAITGTCGTEHFTVVNH